MAIATVQLTIRISQGIYDLMQQYARESGKTQADIMRTALEAYLKGGK